jgi:hypothetical protein
LQRERKIRDLTKEAMMFIHGAEIRLDPEQNGVDVADDDWCIGSGGHFITHMPSHVTFEIGLDEGLERAEKVSVFNFSARPVHICAGHALPYSEDLINLGRGAIILYLQGIGAMQPKRPVEPSRTGESDLNIN